MNKYATRQRRRRRWREEISIKHFTTPAKTNTAKRVARANVSEALYAVVYGRRPARYKSRFWLRSKRTHNILILPLLLWRRRVWGLTQWRILMWVGGGGDGGDRSLGNFFHRLFSSIFCYLIVINIICYLMLFMYKLIINFRLGETRSTKWLENYVYRFRMMK